MELKFGNINVLYNETNGKFLYYLDEEAELVDDAKERMNFDEGYEFDLFSDDYNYETIYICLNPTKSCNLACKYCFNKEKKAISLSLEDAISFIDTVIEKTPKAFRYFLDLSGSGEPLLKLDLILELAKYAKNKSNEIRKEITVLLVCNGTLLTEDNVKKLQEACVLFGVSLDGLKKYHDANRVDLKGEGTYDRILKNIKNIKNREYMGCAVTISDYDCDLVKTCNTLKKYFNTISIKIARKDIDENIEILKNQYRLLTDEMIKGFKTGDLSIILRLLNGDDLFGRFLFRVLADQVTGHRCDAGIGKIALDSNLDIYPCSGATSTPSLKIGHLNEEYDFKDLRKYMLKSMKMTKCQTCEFRRLCGGECLVNLEKNNEPVEAMCELKKYLIKLSILMTALLRTKNLNSYYRIMTFCQEKALRYAIDDDFKRVVEYYRDVPFTELKRVKDDEPNEYRELIANIK